VLTWLPKIVAGCIFLTLLLIDALDDDSLETPAPCNIFYQEDKRNKILQYACRLCQYTEACPEQPLVYRNERKQEVGNILHTVPSAVSDDPTLARSQRANCANCGHHEAVFFQSELSQSDSLALIFVCCNCDHKWVN
jgi:DNA-directed RNA polymerase II subunit RPB9